LYTVYASGSAEELKLIIKGPAKGWQNNCFSYGDIRGQVVTMANWTSGNHGWRSTRQAIFCK